MTNKYLGFVSLLRPYNATSPALAFLIGYFWLGRTDIIFSDVLLGLIAILAIHSWATIENDLSDRVIDQINAPDNPLVKGDVSLRTAKFFSSFFFLVVMVVNIIGFPRHSPFIIAMVILSFFYNRLPFILSKKTFSPLVVLALLYSTIPLLYGSNIALGLVNVNFLFVVSSWFLLRVSVAILKDFKDEKGDRLFGKRTFFITYGKKKVLWVSVVFYTASMVAILSLSFIHNFHWLLFIFIVLGIWILIMRIKMFRADGKKLVDLFHKTFFFQNRFDFLYLIWLLVK